ncbi:hypothetical protein [Devosia sp.]|uniref:hypothetical protein n=1 Tax=Devosia sp. TaxID=1871048 RepID=UPI003BA8599A
MFSNSKWTGVAACIGLVAVLVQTVAIRADEFSGTALTMGVYECHDQLFNIDPVMMFGLLDDTSYKNYDGDVGSYAFDQESGIIQVGLQTSAPARFVRIAATAFRALNEDGTLTGFVCPLNPAKDPNSPPW